MGKILVNGTQITKVKANKVARNLAELAITGGFNSASELDSILSDGNDSNYIKCKALNIMMKKYSKVITSDTNKVLIVASDGAAAKAVSGKLGYLAEEYSNVLGIITSENEAYLAQLEEEFEKQIKESEIAATEKEAIRKAKREEKEAKRKARKEAKQQDNSLIIEELNPEEKLPEDAPIKEESTVIDVEEPKQSHYTVVDERTRIPKFTTAFPNPVLQ